MSLPPTVAPILPLIEPKTWAMRLTSLFRSLLNFPWKNAALTLRERFREDRLGLTASSLTFTTTIALVPFITVALAVFTAFPMFAKFQGVLQQWLVESLIPDNIARQVLGYLNQFAGQASKLGVVGVALLLVSALALILTIDHTLNSIWRVRRPRPLGQRLLVYWAGMTLGPMLLAISLSMTSYAISASKGVVGVIPGGVQLLLDLLQYGMMAGGMAAMYHYVPNIQVKWAHAWVGGLFVSTCFELAKKLLTLYVSKVPTYSMVYGAFATVPILLIWIYVAWVIVLLGAVMTAHLPSLLSGVVKRPRSHGQRFQLALETLQQLDRVRTTVAKGLTIAQLSLLLRVDELQLDPVLETLCELDWIGRLDEALPGETARYVLVADPDTTLLAPLLSALLLQYEDPTRNLWENSRWLSISLRKVL
jgi:membrane protein